MGRHHVLIGNGPAAMSAAEAIREADRDAEIIALSSDPHGYYSRPGLAYYLANELPEKGLFPFTERDVEQLGLRLIAERVVRLDPDAHVVTLQSGHTLTYDRLLIATGSAAIPLNVPGAQLDGVVKLDDMTDARDLIRRCRRAKTAVVVGGGITALEIVEGLRAHHVHVHYLMRRDRYWSNVLSECESNIVEEGLRGQGVEIHYFSDLVGIYGEHGRVTGVQTAAGEHIACDLVAAAIGVMPQVELARSAGLDCERGVLVDAQLRSSSADIFAAGDVAEVYDVASGHRTLDVLWSSAVAMGRVAGRNMATDAVHPYVEPAAPMNVTRLAGFKITIIGTVGSGDDSDLAGIARGDSQHWRELGDAVTVELQSGESHIRLALGERTMAGAVVTGDQALSFPIQELIEAHADISGIIDRLEAPGAAVVQIVSDFHREWAGSRV